MSVLRALLVYDNASSHVLVHLRHDRQLDPIWAATWENQQSECAPSEDSDQPGHPPSLIRVFAVRMKKAWVLSYSLNAQRRLWSDWADAHADLSLRWAHSHFVGFVMLQLISFSARPRSAEYTIGICFETAKNNKAFECFFIGFQHSLWNFSTTGNLHSLKSWLWFASVACVVCLPISTALLNDSWLASALHECVIETTEINIVYCG